MIFFFNATDAFGSWCRLVPYSSCGIVYIHTHTYLHLYSSIYPFVDNCVWRRIQSAKCAAFIRLIWFTLPSHKNTEKRKFNYAQTCTHQPVHRQCMRCFLSASITSAWIQRTSLGAATTTFTQSNNNNNNNHESEHSSELPVRVARLNGLASGWRRTAQWNRFGSI